jgi:hypothetical protein
VVEEELKEQTFVMANHFYCSFSAKTDIETRNRVLRMRNRTVGMGKEEHKDSVLYTCSAL